MNKDEKDFMEDFTDLDDMSVEEIADGYPVLGENAKQRILKQCLRKSGLPDGDIQLTENTGVYEDGNDDEISVSGIERYDEKPLWRRYASSVAVLAVAVVGIASVAVLRGNINSPDDFDISSPPVVSDVSPTSQVTEIVPGSYIDKGYHAGGYDFANDNDYSGIVVGNATTPAEPENTEVSAESYESDININGAVQENPPVTAPPATVPPATEPPTAPSEPATDNTVSEANRSFLNGMYYAEVAGTSGYMGFEFSPEGKVTKYSFNDNGTIMENTIVTEEYELIENHFSFGESGNEFNWKTGTIVNPDDGTGFSVQFDDVLYNFSTKSPEFKSDTIVLDGVWYGESTNGIRTFGFYGDTSGSFIYTDSETGIGFEYRIENNHFFLQLSSGEVSEGDIIGEYNGMSFTVLWNDGVSEYFYSEKLSTPAN